ncbi:MAG: hypothetical protein U0350_19905 [Caldilineaceae bacterium]
MATIINPADILSDEAIEVVIPVQGNYRYNRLYICHGIVVINWGVDGDNFDNGRLEFTIPDPKPEETEIDPDTKTPRPVLDLPPSLRFAKPDYVGDAITSSVALASIEAEDNDWGFHVNSCEAFFDSTERIKVIVEVEAKAKSGVLGSLAYNVSFLARRGP